MIIKGVFGGEQKYFVRPNLGDCKEGDMLTPGSYFVLRFRDMFTEEALEGYKTAVVRYLAENLGMDAGLQKDLEEYVEQIQKLIEKSKDFNNHIPN